MRYNVKVIPRSGRIEVKEENGILKVRLTKPACDGLANSQLTEVLAGHFNVRKYQVRILKGLSSRNKIIDIDDGSAASAEK